MCSCNCTFFPINICIESKHPIWLVCFSWTDGSGELHCHLSTVLCIQLGSLYHGERERDYDGKIKSLIPKHFLGFSGQFWWNTLFFCSCKLSKYSRKTIFQYPSYISWFIHTQNRKNIFFFFWIMCSIVWFRDYGTRLMSSLFWIRVRTFLLQWIKLITRWQNQRISTTKKSLSKGKQESGKENL